MTATAPLATSTPADGGSQAARAQQVFVGRQPILDRRQQVYGYELLHRSGPENVYRHHDGNQATLSTMNTTLNVVGLRELVGSHKAFVNITRKLLLDEAYTVLPVQTAVVELLESVTPDAEVLAACRALKQAGYLLALDDFTLRAGYADLVPLADFLKIDFVKTPPDQRRVLAAEFRHGPVHLLAEKVETQQDFAQALDLGYVYFQGYFFCKPQVVSGREIPAAKRMCLHCLHEIYQPAPDYDRIDEAIKSDVSLSYKLLRYLNSAFLGLPAKVRSIRDGLALLGEAGLRRWATVAVATSLGQDKPPELARICLVRGRFCELIAPKLGLAGKESDLFLLGLLSAADALVDQPMTKVLAQLSLNPIVKAALLGAASPLAPAYGLVLACERGNWAGAAAMAGGAAVSEADITAAYHDALLWADRVVTAA